MMQTEIPQTKKCSVCLQVKPLTDFRRRTGRRAGAGSRRGPCRDCRSRQRSSGEERTEAGLSRPQQQAPAHAPRKPAAEPPQQRPEEQRQVQPPQAPHQQRRGQPQAPGHQQPQPPGQPQLPDQPPQPHRLKPMRSGKVRMRGRSDSGRRWQQEVELELARVLVEEQAAVIVNPHTIRRLFSNREFKKFIMERDRYTCYFCGEEGTTIDHLLPRAKGGHTTPANCVCACSACNQSKADRDVADFMSTLQRPLEERE
ncbi:HNH endonuclease [Paenibacillus pinistramenti]|uniref:HNH endonuclease n=1 Tax=Paenibacillus pinistramenti TaxID=1768003 RepID=UPI0011086242|nr:HNH endonuclease [Paenibacillus pinistramenti]